MSDNSINFKTTIVFQQTWESSQSGNYKLIEQQGGSRSSKTWSDFQVIFLDLFSNPMTTCTILRDTQKSCRDIVEVDWVKWLSDPMGRKKELEEKRITITEFDKLIEQENLLKYFTRNKTNHTWTFNHNDSFIRFTGLDDENDAMGMTQDICWINEPYAFSHEVYKQLSQRTSKYILFDWNPKQNHWIDDERKKDNTITLKSTLLDNPFCPEESRIQILSYQPVSYCDVVVKELIKEEELKEYDFDLNPLQFTRKQIKEAQRCLYNDRTNSSSEYHWLVYGLGEKAEKPNKIYSWTKISPDQYDSLDAKEYHYSDWGTVDPWAIGSVKYYDGALYVKERNYLSENQIREKDKGIAQMFADGEDLGIVEWMFVNKLNISKSDAIICDRNRLLKIAMLRRCGFDNVEPAIKPAGSIIDGINIVSDLKVYYTSDSTNIEYEQDNYSRKVDRYGIVLEEPEDKDNHHMDGIRYVALHLVSLGIIKRI